MLTHNFPISPPLSYPSTFQVPHVSFSSPILFHRGWYHPWSVASFEPYELSLLLLPWCQLMFCCFLNIPVSVFCHLMASQRSLMLLLWVHNLDYATVLSFDPFTFIPLVSSNLCWFLIRSETILPTLFPLSFFISYTAENIVSVIIWKITVITCVC